MLIRPSTLIDARPLAELHVRSWRVAYRGILPDKLLDQLTVEEREQYRIADMTNPPPHKRCWTLDIAGRPAGFAVTGANRDGAPASVAEVYAIYLAPEAWGKGAGRALMTHCLADLRARGFSSVALWTLRDNFKARRFYEAAGFAFEGVSRCKQWKGVDFHEVRYARPL